MVPSTGTGRVVSIAMCVFGVLLLGFMFAAVSEALRMTEKAGLAANILEMEVCMGREREAAAKVLQVRGGWWVGGGASSISSSPKHATNSGRAPD